MGHELMPLRNSKTAVYLATIGDKSASRIEGWEKKERKKIVAHRQE